MSFSTFNLDPRLAKAITDLGYETPTPIQEQAIPAVISGKDVLGLAQTGTGKTAAFALPIIQRLLSGQNRRTRALIIAPTRELASQIDEAIADFAKNTDVRSVAVYGGVGMAPQIRALRAGVEIVVACPGRLLDHIRQGIAKLGDIEVLVLDEADQMFDMGFLPTVREIIRHLPKVRQSLLFSATMPAEISHIAKSILVDPVTIKVGSTAPTTTVSHAIYPVSQQQKTSLVQALLREISSESVLIFTRTKHRAKGLSASLRDNGFKATELQGNLSQSRRKAAMDGFRSGRYQILVATDIAARGIDISSISHVINYDMPATVEAYTHRIGRTGRAAKTGDAFTLVTGADHMMVRSIERVLGAPIERRTVEKFAYDSANSTQSRSSTGRATQQQSGGQQRAFAGGGGGGGGGRSPWRRSSRPTSSRRYGR